MQKEEKDFDLHNDKEEYVEVWEDIVSIKDLIISLVISAVTTLGSYFIAPNEPPMPLFFGLAGALIGFGIASFIIKPKRVIQQDRNEIKNGN